MKIQLFAVSLTLMYLTVHCVPVDVKLNENGAVRPHRSNHAMVMVGFYGPMKPQFNAQSEENGVTENQEAPISNDGNVQPDITQENVPNESDLPQSVPENTYDPVTEASNVDGPVTQKVETPAKESPESDEDYDDDDDDEDEDLWNIGKMGKKNRPAINFFPVSFGSGKGRNGGFSGGTVAIANSFSNGRRGVASSLANAGAVDNISRN